MEAAVLGTELPELPVEILVNILALLEIPDLVRAGSVCSSWNAAYTSLRSLGTYRRPQTPCLLYTSESDGDNVACLYSLAEKRVYKLTLPEPPMRSRHLIGSSNGWLVTADERSELHITNPITGEQIALPSVTTIEQVKPIFDDAGAIQKYEFSQYFGNEVINDPSIHSLDKLRDHLYVKASVFSDPSTKSYIVVLIHNPICQLSFTRIGDSEWTWLPPSAGYEDCIYIDGVLYALTATGGIDAFDLSGPAVSRKVIIDNTKNYIFERLYIVQTPSGDVLHVWREQDIAASDAEGEGVLDPLEIKTETRKIVVYKVNMATKELVQIDSLKDHVLFLGHSQSQCLTAEEYPHLKANHAYLTDNVECIASWKSNCRNIGIFSLGNGSTEEILPPQLWCTWPAPIWIAPNLTNVSSGSNHM
ncbi:hypothetical protein HU200_038116 [Digitaria exilis]|uniref:F-box domain-containing protein n=1 Tax=Digitaria exilis TaxID=1010633 RepID=A0A835BD06_9POAL|nr:hypothetical protein HU200_038116 [Digitaria exilis]